MLAKTLRLCWLNSKGWKKKRGVSDEAYDAWYGGARLDAAAGTAEGEGQVDTAGAFGSEDGAAETAAVPTNCGELMVWVSEQITAGKFTHDDVTAAYAANNITVQDIIPPHSDEVVAERIAVLHAALSA